MKKTILLSLTLLSFSIAKAQNPTSGILYVDSAHTTGVMDGSSWANALPSLADALKWANDNKANWATTPLKIYVAKGTYLPKFSPQDGLADPANPTDNRNKAFLMVKNVHIYGGFPTGGSTFSARDWNLNPTILSGDFNGNDVVTGAGFTLTFTNNDENSFHVVVSAGAVGSARLDAVNIKGGNANGSSSITVNTYQVYNYFGGGMYNYSSSPTITNSTFANNYTNANGGGMYNYYYSSPTITNSTIANNLAFNGGGMYNYSSSSPTITNSTIANNSAYYGGGIRNNSSSPTITNSTIANNSANSIGGGMYNYYSSPTINNSILFGNTAPNNAVMLSGNNSTPIVKNSLIEGVSWNATIWGTDGGGNILSTTNPFTNSATGDFTLNSSSVAINAGNNALYNGNINSDLDLGGNPRLNGVNIDMGAYESLIVVPLATYLLEFNAYCENKTRIEWQTASELNVSYFEIQYTREANNWKTIAQIPASGNVSGKKYEYYTNSQEELSYYRLCAVDKDGSIQIFSPIVVACNQDNNDWMVFPNPANNFITIQHPSETIQDILLLDNFGRTVLQTKIDARDTFTFDVSNIKNGLYILQITTNQGATTKKIKINH
ncbi:MAG: T9SS type A sorting domain-containing protein [Crocinitomicaceae bacterium]